MAQVIGFGIDDGYTQRIQLFAKLPWHVARHVADHRCLLIYCVWESRHLVAKVNERFLIVCGQQGSGTVANGQRIQGTFVSPAKHFAQIPITRQTEHGSMTTREKYGDIRSVIGQVVFRKIHETARFLERCCEVLIEIRDTFICCALSGQPSGEPRAPAARAWPAR